MKGSTIRKIGLIVFIAFYALACVSAIMMGQMLFFYALLGCGASVGIGEGVSVWLTGLTLSTKITRAWKEGGAKAVWGIIMCLSLIALMVALGVHFIPWEKLLGQ